MSARELARGGGYASGERHTRSHHEHERGDHPARCERRHGPVTRVALHPEIFVELERVGRSPAASKLAIGARNLGDSVRVAAGTVRMVLFDELLVGLFNGRGIGPGCKAQDGKCGDAAGHESGV